MKMPGSRRIREIADEKVIQPVRNAMGVAIVALCVALFALLFAIGGRRA
jgi:hypothetical protein